MTEFRRLELRIISARDLKDVNFIGKMKTYVVAYVNPFRKVSTHLDKDGGKNPVWDEKLVIPVEEQLLTQQAVLSLEIYSHGSLSPKMVGSTQIPLAQAASAADKSDSSGFQRLDLQIRRPSGRIQGSITISSFQLGEKISMPTPTPMNQSSSSRPVPTYPPAAGYAPSSGPYQPYPPPQYQYPGAGYPPAAYPQPNYYTPPPPGRSRFGGGGGGMGAGLLGGLLGDFCWAI
ncbi:hypothetical protein O6H91_18G013300 [Diphasiastrum complanatum]|uniref:Uncharacterized protein n=1 Tax=Diphasiastrum complanatum TaxID=34168 RepID=A0ACC2AYC4_DIPCM|nr:hypothetical protein O6H91_18G013300 [Diphasiastrum complanatum]